MVQPVHISTLMSGICESLNAVKAPRPKRAERPTCGARCRSRLELETDAPASLSALARKVHAALLVRGGKAPVRAFLAFGGVVAVRAAVNELAASGAARFGACGAHVVADRDATGAVRMRSRCRLHGGSSTGAKTAEGRARLAEAGRSGAAERWRRWRIVRVNEAAS